MFIEISSIFLLFFLSHQYFLKMFTWYVLSIFLVGLVSLILIHPSPLNMGFGRTVLLPSPSQCRDDRYDLSRPSVTAYFQSIHYFREASSLWSWSFVSTISFTEWKYKIFPNIVTENIHTRRKWMMIWVNVCSWHEHGHAKHPMIQSHGSGKAFFGWGSEEQQILPVVECEYWQYVHKMSTIAFFSKCLWPKAMPYGALPTDIRENSLSCSAVCNYPSLFMHL